MGVLSEVECRAAQGPPTADARLLLSIGRVYQHIDLARPRIVKARIDRLEALLAEAS